MARVERLQLAAADRVETFDGRYLFAYMINRPPTRAAISCVDLTTGNRCAGYPFTTSVSNNFLGQTSLMVLPVLDSSRAATGVCIAAVAISTAASNTSYQCVDTSAKAIPNPYPIPTGSAPSHATFGNVLVLGTRVYYPQITYTPVTHTIQYQCYDFAAAAPCAGFASPRQTSPYVQGQPGNQRGNLTPYNVTSNPDVPGCLGEDGDTGMIQFFDGRTGALGCSGVLGDVSVDPAASYCATHPGHPTGWDQVLISGIPEADYKGATLTVRDSNGEAVPGFEVVPLSSAKTSLDISSIPLSGATSKLSATVNLASPPAGVTPQVSLSFKGDAAEICFKTTVGRATCKAALISNNANAVTTGSNGNSDAPGGDEAGTASFTVAAARTANCIAARPDTKSPSVLASSASALPTAQPSPPAPASSLPFTGFGAVIVTVLGLAGLGGGVVLLGAGKRRRRSHLRP
ncbi:MAG: hypothetical protein JO086_00980 [Acidimicrobiia bacterium]|nr:hypothetical protein [Acidimicrobiia bacterium]